MSIEFLNEGQRFTLGGPSRHTRDVYLGEIPNHANLENIKTIGMQAKCEKTKEKIVFMIEEASFEQKEKYGVKYYTEAHTKWHPILEYDKQTGVLSSKSSTKHFDGKLKFSTVSHFHEDFTTISHLGYVQSYDKDVSLFLSKLDEEEFLESETASGFWFNCKSLLSQLKKSFDQNSNGKSFEEFEAKMKEIYNQSHKINSCKSMMVSSGVFMERHPFANTEYISNDVFARIGLLDSELSVLKLEDSLSDIDVFIKNYFPLELLAYEPIYQEALTDFMSAVIIEQHPYVYCKMIKQLMSRNQHQLFSNLWMLMAENKLDVLENMEKNLGIDFCINQLSGEFKMNMDSSKLTKIMQLPSKIISFLKDNDLINLSNDFKIICAVDNNEGLAVINWYNLYSKVKGFKNGLKNRFNRFVSYLAKIKDEHPQVSIFPLLNYVASQRFWFEPNVADKFELPLSELQTYRDYLNLGGWNQDHWPSNLTYSHNILARNANVLLDESICEKFNEVVKPFVDYEFSDSSLGFCVVAPTTAEELVSEGLALNHCVATYVPLIAKGEEKVMFVRSLATPTTSLYTISFDDDFNILQFKKNYDETVNSKEALEFVKKWATAMLKKKGK